MLTVPQLATLKAAILAETNPEFVAYRDGGNAGQMAVWLNDIASPAAAAWNHDEQRRDIDEAANYASFDTISAGKRDAWRIYLDGFPRNMRKAKNRTIVTDVWGSNAIADAILTAGTRNITRAEKILGGSATAQTGTITAINLTWVGPLSPADVVDALQ